MLKNAIAKIRYLFQYRNKAIDRVMFYLSLALMALVVNDIGNMFGSDYQSDFDILTVYFFYLLFVLTAVVTTGEIYFTKFNLSHYTSIVVLVYFLFVSVGRLLSIPFFDFLQNETWLQLGIAIVFILQLSKNSLFFDNLYFNPTILFVISFLVIILIGTFLLMMPRATYSAPLGFIDAFFMATSAVCITGLGVVDVATDFSLFGKTVVMVLLQVGGLGIMTFTGFFGYFFSGGFSFKNQLMYGEILSENKLNSVISTLLKIILITLLFEFIGGVFIYLSLEDHLFSGKNEKLFFTAFHTISAFCNAGFSTIDGGLGNADYRFNYSLQNVLAFMFILGGLGFGVIYNFYTFIHSKIKSLIYKFVLHKKYRHNAQLFTFNTKFVLVCNAVVIVLATVSFFFLENHNVLADDQSLYGKISSSFFSANNGRSTGFGRMDVSTFMGPTFILFLLLMWIGSSPGSTGGGVKVTTVAIALLNVVFLAKGKKDMEIFKRRIADETKNKAFAIIVLSFLVIITSFILLNFSDGDKPMKDLLFESISAYATSGLSMGVTPNLSSIGKMIIIFTMFVGRVGMLTVLVAFIKNTKNKSYTYPTEKILF